ncbi:uncharacterized protein MONBRDRAFT_24251 [Monosiga brevicollis MX1]|uniref:SH2 domain-containing protein n=1 Tax=Monosiga brevicollis TaxID=81824 RepID=A9UVV0_MONBE|nr:uncharacterized protein MONBRDRAFT_24251 [Monosiga brevicollis MX1]EDQ90453.1 predicted protein [Monosiga brevicollis MX1]|eukprot:XP_001744504.1 hypothetical protein [Monosiga brevicollis MX1]
MSTTPSVDVRDTLFNLVILSQASRMDQQRACGPELGGTLVSNKDLGRVKKCAQQDQKREARRHRRANAAASTTKTTNSAQHYTPSASAVGSKLRGRQLPTLPSQRDLLQSFDFYIGDVSRAEANVMLGKCEDGTYLVRRSADRFVVSIIWRDNPNQDAVLTHIRVHTPETAGRRGFGLAERDDFPTMEALVQHYENSPFLFALRFWHYSERDFPSLKPFNPTRMLRDSAPASAASTPRPSTISPDLAARGVAPSPVPMMSTLPAGASSTSNATPNTEAPRRGPAPIPPAAPAQPNLGDADKQYEEPQDICRIAAAVAVGTARANSSAKPTTTPTTTQSTPSRRASRAPAPLPAGVEAASSTIANVSPLGYAPLAHASLPVPHWSRYITLPDVCLTPTTDGYEIPVRLAEALEAKRAAREAPQELARTLLEQRRGASMDNYAESDVHFDVPGRDKDDYGLVRDVQVRSNLANSSGPAAQQTHTLAQDADLADYDEPQRVFAAQPQPPPRLVSQASSRGSSLEADSDANTHAQPTPSLVGPPADQPTTGGACAGSEERPEEQVDGSKVKSPQEAETEGDALPAYEYNDSATLLAMGREHARLAASQRHPSNTVTNVRPEDHDDRAPVPAPRTLAHGQGLVVPIPATRPILNPPASSGVKPMATSSENGLLASPPAPTSGITDSELERRESKYQTAYINRRQVPLPVDGQGTASPDLQRSKTVESLHLYDLVC